MSCKPKAKNLRAPNGVELMNRFAKSQPVIRAESGGEFGLPINKVPMGAQDQGAFDNIRGTPAQATAAVPNTGASPLSKTGTRVDPASLLGSGSWQNMAVPQLRDGGEIHAANGFFDNLRKVVMPTDAEKAAKAQYLADSRPAPAPTPAPAQTGISGYAGNSALESRMKALGLRDGGDNGYVSVMDRVPDMANPTYRAYLEQHQALEGSHPELLLGQGARAGIQAVKEARALMAARQAAPSPVTEGMIGQYANSPLNHLNFPPQMPAEGSLARASAGSIVQSVKNARGAVGWNLGAQDNSPKAGLRDGGDLRTGQGGVVPGIGTGDKIPAKYEPGEFVVSNDMLDAQPALRGHLRGLRAEVLANKGMTPAMADAKAVSGKGLRAVNAFGDFYDDMGEPLGQQGASPKTPPTTMANPSNPNIGANGSDEARAFRQSVTAPAVPEAAPTGRFSSLRQGVSGAWSGAKSIGSSLASGVRAAGPALTAGGTGYGAAQLAQGADNPARGPQGGYVPPAAVNQIPTDRYGAAPAAQPYNYFTDTDTGRNLKNLSGALSMLPSVSPLSGAVRAGSNAARALGTVETLGAATAGGARAGMEPTHSQGAVAPIVPTAPQPDYSGANSQSSAHSLRLGDPSSSDLKNEFSNAMIENRNPGGKVTKVVGPDGKVSYSGGNVSGEVSFQGADGNALRGRPGGGYMSTSADDGAGLAEARASLRNPDGSQWSANDNAIMAANLRDSVDKYRGTSRDTQGAGANKYAGMPIKTAAAMMVADAQNAAQLRATGMNNDTSLRTTAMNNDTSLMGNRMTNAFNGYKFGIEQGNNQRDYNRNVSNDRVAQQREGSKAWDDHALSSFQKKDTNGNTVNDAQAAAGYTDFANQLMLDPAMKAKYPRGLSDLDPADRASLLNLYRTKQIQDKTHSSLAPWGSHGTTSNRPQDYIPTGQGNGSVRNANGDVPLNALRYGADYNILLPNFGAADTTLLPPSKR